ncbi:stage III sporulation protein AF [Heyndrickxia acidiproducens]|uniref:stage III sporulation protein AF n=1 Tax=Heyndrickxia acidiproducens TaxID=1121084 RepID=UPI0003828008|nr:stage III sporulation protein AF [Heyndrickxia acidiproducens]
MDYLTKWVLNILIFILLAMVVDMLLPESDMRKYTKLVIGLLLITVILTPIFKLFSLDPAQILETFSTDQMKGLSGQENSLDTKKKEINSLQQEYTLQQMAVQMKEDAEGEIEKKYGKKIADIQIELKDGKNAGNMTEWNSAGDVKKITVYLQAENQQDEVAAIEPIEIRTDEKADQKGSDEQESIRSMLSTRWNMSKQKIELHIEGGS